MLAEKSEEASQLHFYDFAPKNAKKTKIEKTIVNSKANLWIKSSKELSERNILLKSYADFSG